MKCELLCEKCGDDAKKERFPNPNRYENERVMLVKGECEGVYICDFCNADVLPGDTAVAQTFLVLNKDDLETRWFDNFISNPIDLYSNKKL